MQLGSKVKDVITGFTGVVTGTVQYITGCNQALVQPEMKKDTYVESRWFDMDRLKVLPGAPFKLAVKDAGPDKPAPRR